MKTAIFLYGIGFGIMVITGVVFEEFIWAVPAMCFAGLAWVEGKKVQRNGN